MYIRFSFRPKLHPCFRPCFELYRRPDLPAHYRRCFRLEYPLAHWYRDCRFRAHLFLLQQLCNRHFREGTHRSNCRKLRRPQPFCDSLGKLFLPFQDLHRSFGNILSLRCAWFGKRGIPFAFSNLITEAVPPSPIKEPGL